MTMDVDLPVKQAQVFNRGVCDEPNPGSRLANWCSFVRVAQAGVACMLMVVIVGHKSRLYCDLNCIIVVRPFLTGFV